MLPPGKDSKSGNESSTPRCCVFRWLLAPRSRNGDSYMWQKTAPITTRSHFRLDHKFRKKELAIVRDETLEEILCCDAQGHLNYKFQQQTLAAAEFRNRLSFVFIAQVTRSGVLQTYSATLCDSETWNNWLHLCLFQHITLKIVAHVEGDPLEAQQRTKPQTRLRL